MRYLYDPGQQAIMLSKEDLREGIDGAGVLFGNEYELGIMIERTGWSRDELTSHVPTMIITLAEKGTLLVQKGKEIGIGAVKVEHAVDPTGAGDAYRAGFIFGMRNGLPVETSIKLASTVAAYAVEKKGTQNHSFTLEDVKARYEAAYDEPLQLR
jgi:adenosine kinase